MKEHQGTIMGIGTKINENLCFIFVLFSLTIIGNASWGIGSGDHMGNNWYPDTDNSSHSISSITEKVYYQKYDGTIIDTPSTIQATTLGYRINWLGMGYDLVWDRTTAYDTLYYPNGTFVSPWIFPQIEYWKPTSKKWVEVNPVSNSFEQSGNQIIRQMVLSDGSNFNITYIASDKIQYIWNFTAGANQNYSIVFRVDSIKSQDIDVKRKKFTPGYPDNFMDYGWTDIPEPYATNTSSWYEAGDRKFLVRMILGIQEIDAQVSIDTAWSTKGINAFKSLSGDLIEIATQDSPPQPYLKLNKWDGDVSLKIDVPYGKDGTKTLNQNRLKFANHKSDPHSVPFHFTFAQLIRSQ